MSGDVVIHLSGTVEMFSDGVVDVNIDSLGEIVGDEGCKVILSRVEVLLFHVSGDLSHGINTNFSDDLSSGQTSS